MDETILFIPIRRGSKGIPNKNLKMLCGKPLVCWILDTLLSMELQATIWVATDSPEAVAVLKERYGEGINVFIRSEKSATDTSPVIDVVKEFIRAARPVGTTNFILAQATVPFTSTKDYAKLFSAISSNTADSFVSCCRVKKFLWSEEGVPLSYELDRKPMRQHYKGILIENGAFYATTVESIRQTSRLLSGRIGIVETGEGTLIDIDEPSDWIVAEQFASQKIEKNS